MSGGSYPDATFMFLCMILVQLMTPGLAFFYGGLVRSTHIVTIMMQNFLAMGVVFMLWYITAFSVCFGPSVGGLLGNPFSYFFFKDVGMATALPNVPNMPGALFAGYQGMFAIISPALMTGAFADRVLLGPFVILIAVWTLLVYAPTCHWIWGGGFMSEWGIFDFAGGIVVHTTSGFSALATLIIIGPRNLPDSSHKQPHNIPFVVLGTALLWFGWFGFNGGSALGMNRVAMAAAMNSQMAACVALCGWLILDVLNGKKPSLVNACVGAVAGLATITPCAGYVPLWASFLVGAAACVICWNCVLLIEKFHLDDALDVFGVHGMGGFCGTIMVGIFADTRVDPEGPSASLQLTFLQFLSAVIVAAYSFLVTYAVLRILDRLMGIRPPKLVESNLDKALHGESAYYSHKSGSDLLEDGHLSTSDEETFEGSEEITEKV